MQRILIEIYKNCYFLPICYIENGFKSLFQVLFVFIRLFVKFVMKLSGG